MEQEKPIDCTDKVFGRFYVVLKLNLKTNSYVANDPERGMWLILPTAASLFSGSGNAEGMDKKGR